MPLDSYTLCPCGSGKKVKFCCSKDLLHDLEKIVRALDGEQLTAAMDQTAKLIAERGPRAALLSIQCEIQLALEQVDDAEKTANQLLAVMPHNPVASGVLAITDVLHGKVDDGIKHLQHALENLENSMSNSTATAITIVCQALLQSGKFMAARGHLLLRAGLSGGKDEDAIRQMMELNRMEGFPTLLKQDFQYGECPPGVPWQGEFDAAMKCTRRGAWLASCESLDSLNQKVPNQPAVLRTIAVLRGWLGQNNEACAAWRKYETLPGVPEDEAVEVEALCQLLQPAENAELTDELEIVFPIVDTEKLMETLLSDKRMVAVPFDPQEFIAENQPPPKGLFKLLDRPMPATHEGLAFIDVPQVLGDLLVFGKQTDREARLQLQITRTPRLDEAKTKLREIAGEWIQPNATEEVLEQVNGMKSALNPEVRFPRDTTKERAIELMTSYRDSVYSTVWPDLPRKIFAGKSAREAVRDPKLRIRVMAALLNLELATEEQSVQHLFDFNRVRRELGIPERGTYHLDGEHPALIPVARLSRLAFAELSDEQLLDVFRLLTLKSMQLAMRRCAQELIARPTIAENVDLAEVYRILVTVAGDDNEALQYIDTGRRITADKGKSPASWYLLELQVRLARYEAEHCNRLIKLLTTRHGSEPGIRESLYQVLRHYGIISEDGQPAGSPTDAAAAAPEPGDSSSQPAKLWTPETAAPKQESKLWLPGMS